MKAKAIKYAAIAAAAMLVACNSPKGWQVSGNIAGAPEDTKVAIEGFNAHRWYNIDSVAIDKKGDFAYHAPEAVAYPDIYRVSLNGQCIYFPIYGDEKVKVTANAEDFEASATVEGNDHASAIADIDKRILKEVKEQGVEAALSDSVLKADLNSIILNDTVGIVAYYVINKSVAGKALYVANNRKDVSMFGAVANRFSMSMPDDPRTAVLKEQFLAARRQLGGDPGVVYELEGDGYLDLAFYDERGVERKLSDAVKANPIVLLSFTDYTIEPSLAYNAELNNAVEAFRQKGIEVYQVSVDNDEVAWRETATNLPWVTVRHNPLNTDNLIMQYNVAVIPLTYVIVNGDIVERVLDPTELIPAIRKHIK